MKFGFRQAVFCLLLGLAGGGIFTSSNASSLDSNEGRSGSPSQTQLTTQKALLIEDDPMVPGGKIYPGRAVWRTEIIPGPGGQPRALEARIDVEIPARGVTMTFSLGRNTDAALPASHTALLAFYVPPTVNGGSVADAPEILMDRDDLHSGTALAGLSAQVKDNSFLIALSNADKASNVALLRDLPWLDVPITYKNLRRAVIAIEKGGSGQRVLTSAFAAWGQ